MVLVLERKIAGELCQKEFDTPPLSCPLSEKVGLCLSNGSGKVIIKMPFLPLRHVKAFVHQPNPHLTLI